MFNKIKTKIKRNPVTENINNINNITANSNIIDPNQNQHSYQHQYQYQMPNPHINPHINSNSNSISNSSSSNNGIYHNSQPKNLNTILPQPNHINNYHHNNSNYHHNNNGLPPPPRYNIQSYNNIHYQHNHKHIQKQNNNHLTHMYNFPLPPPAPVNPPPAPVNVNNNDIELSLSSNNMSSTMISSSIIKPNTSNNSPISSTNPTTTIISSVSGPGSGSSISSSNSSSLKVFTRQRRSNKKIIYNFRGEKFKIWDYYKPVRIIGHGAYAVVIEAIDTRFNGRHVAIKKNKSVFSELTDAKRILREIKLLMTFSHDDIIRLLDVIPPDADNISRFNDVYLVMPRMETTLKRIIKSEQKLENRHYLFFIYQILRGLKYIHSAGVIHRDLKPENILINGKNCNVKISDFGLARDINPTDIISNNLTEYVITRWYRAPEVMVCAKNYNSAVDIWSVGCIFGELLLRRELFPGNNHFEQLSLIFSIIGTPPKKGNNYKWITSDDAKDWINNLEYQPGHDLRKIFKNGKPEAIDLIKNMLIINPNKRIDVVSALSHPYFAKLHHKKSEKVIKKENIPSFKFEKKLNNIFSIRHLMYQTLINFDPQWKKNKKLRLIKTDRANINKNINNNNSMYKPPPNNPPESC